MKHKNLEVKFLKLTGTKGFALLAGTNRDIIPNHVTKMCNSIDEMGVIRPVVVATFDFLTGAPVTYIIDGQHLYHACMRLGYDVPYTEIDITNSIELAQKLALLNNSSKSWSMHDYIKVWSNVEKDYVKLNKYFNTYDVELLQVSDILMNNQCRFAFGGTAMSTPIKKGEFKINNEERGVFLLDCITDALKIIKRMDRISNKLFIASYVNFINMYASSYDHELFIANLKINKEKFKMITQDPEEYNKLIKSIM
jgi:hypothetical protein